MILHTFGVQVLYGLGYNPNFNPSVSKGPKELKRMLRDYSQHRFKVEAHLSVQGLGWCRV